MNATENAIMVSQLTRRFGDFVAVDNVDFHVRKGEIFGFLGANGAGKTTLIKLLTGLIKPTGGSAIINGLDIYKYPEQIKKQIGYMSQKFSLYEDLTVKENIELFGGIYHLGYSIIRSRTEFILRKLNLTSEENTLIRNLPVGARQKLAFCIAIVHEPSIVYLDEPTSGVDPATSRQFWALMYEASKKGTTLFLTTHNMAEAEYCDRIAFMVNGRIAECDTPNMLKSKHSGVDINDVFIKIANQYAS